MNAEISGRLNSALAHLIRDVLERDAPPDMATPPPCAYALQGLMRVAAVNADIGQIAQLHTDHGHLLRTTDRTDRCRIVVFSEPACDASERLLLQSGFRDDIGLTENLIAPDLADSHAATVELTALKPLLAADLPLWWAELQELLDTIILTTAANADTGFAGASAFDVWGAILINPAYRRDRLHLALTMVHESSHLKLFHAYLDDDIVLNPADQTFSSPLRQTPRPMNGLYHVAFVLARMAVFIADIARAGAAERLFGAGAGAALQDQLDQSVRNFDSAHAIIAAHGRLTAKGQQILAEAAAGVSDCRHMQWVI